MRDNKKKIQLKQHIPQHSSSPVPQDTLKSGIVFKTILNQNVQKKSFGNSFL